MLWNIETMIKEAQVLSCPEILLMSLVWLKNIRKSQLMLCLPSGQLKAFRKHTRAAAVIASGPGSFTWSLQLLAAIQGTTATGWG